MSRLRAFDKDNAFYLTGQKLKIGALIQIRDHRFLFAGLSDSGVVVNLIAPRGDKISLRNTTAVFDELRILRNTGIVINLEGVDSVGKATHTKLASEYLEGLGLKTSTVNFPDYDSRTGKLVRTYLNGGFGDALGIPGELASALYMLDRAKYVRRFEQELSDCQVILLDRYVYSNVTFQSVKNSVFDEDTLNHMRQHCEAIEFDEIGLPRPDEVIFLDGNPDVCAQLLADRQDNDSIDDGSDVDQHESNSKFLMAAYTAYRQLAKDLNWASVAVTKGKTINKIPAIQFMVRRRILETLFLF